MDGAPLPLLVTMRNVSPGEELLLDYGPDYCECARRVTGPWWTGAWGEGWRSVCACLPVRPCLLPVPATQPVPHQPCPSRHCCCHACRAAVV